MALEVQIKEENPMDQLNVRQQAFVRKHFQELKPASVAYAEAYNTDPSLPHVQANAIRLKSNEKVKEAGKSLTQQFIDDAPWAYEKLKEMVKDTKTPAATREKILTQVIDRGHGSVTQKLESKNETTFKGLNDNTDWAQKALEDIVNKQHA